MQSWFQNVLILKPQHEIESNQVSSPRCLASCLDLGLNTHIDERARRSNSSSAFPPPVDAQLGKEIPVWQRIQCKQFQRLHGSHPNPVIYKFQRVPPSVPVPLRCDSSASFKHHENLSKERQESFISPLTQRMLNEVKQRSEKHCKGKAALKEHWCTCKRKKISSAEDQEKDFGLRCTAALCISDADTRTVWKKLSNAVANGSLGDCNSCFKRNENQIYVFFYENKRQLIEQWLESVFHKTVVLKAM